MTAPNDPVLVARRYLGIKESPPGSNHQQFGVWYGVDRVPWCAIFWSYCLYVAGYRFPDATTPKGFAYVPYIIDWGLKHGRISRTPHLGDAACLVEGGLGVHVELVSKPASGPNAFTSIGGNTGDASVSDGGEVVEHDHPLGSWVFVSPFYTPTPRPAPVPVPPGVRSPITQNWALTTPYAYSKQIVWAQQRLAGYGYPISKADGVYGPQTYRAVVAFQTRTNLVVDGVLGPITGEHIVMGR